MAKHKEGKVEAYFVEQVEAKDGVTRKVTWIGRRGCPDRFWAFGRLGARCGFAEIKSPEGRLDPHQAREIKRLTEAGVTVYVIDSFEAVDKFLEREA